MRLFVRLSTIGGVEESLPRRRKLLALADAAMEFAPDGWRSQATPCSLPRDTSGLTASLIPRSVLPGHRAPELGCPVQLAAPRHSTPCQVELPTARTQSRGAGGHLPGARAYLRGWCCAAGGGAVVPRRLHAVGEDHPPSGGDGPARVWLQLLPPDMVSRALSPQPGAWLGASGLRFPPRPDLPFRLRQTTLGIYDSRRAAASLPLPSAAGSRAPRPPAQAPAPGRPEPAPGHSSFQIPRSHAPSRFGCPLTPADWSGRGGGRELAG